MVDILVVSISCGLILSQKEPNIMPNRHQNIPIVKALAILKLIKKLEEIVTLSGLGGKSTYARAIIMA